MKAVKAQKGIVTDSVVAIVVRPGNPLGIHSWNDLLNSGVKIVTPDPISSGSARWNLLAAYESQIDQGSNATAANTYINALIKNVISEPSSGSKALSAFIAGTGNVLLAYESDALNAFVTGQKLQIVQPAQNLLIQNPAALTTTGSKNPAAVAFYDFIFSKAGQEIWLQQHFRPTLASLAAVSKTTFYTPVTLNTIHCARRMDKGHAEVLLTDRHHHPSREREWIHQLDRPSSEHGAPPARKGWRRFSSRLRWCFGPLRRHVAHRRLPLDHRPHSDRRRRGARILLHQSTPRAGARRSGTGT